ncbi:helix-turn-helix domain-containing protein [Kistimonas scapharcae]|uniref:Helix-turn-helix domain-containing protein n=1 Tax=Kistimonas scapharcae TaxID=1036133 RepID=A0ABP8V3H5_9GAMM
MALNSTLCRHLALAWLIDTMEHPNVPNLQARTGWPRRTLQDAIKRLPAWGITVEYVQDYHASESGFRGQQHNAGYYVLRDWGMYRREWVKKHLADVFDSVELAFCE